jgi:arsenite methyltransferase
MKNQELKRMEEQRDRIHQLVKEKYAGIAKGSTCGCAPSCCSGSTSLVNIIDMGKALDYAEEDLVLAPGEANLGLGCGNPIGIAGLRPSETVLDLGSGAGFDAFLAAKKVGDTGKVIGVDMTPEMVEKARSNAEGLKISNVEFRLGKIEELPVEDKSVDVVISNCVINLSPDKSSVFKEMYRILKPNGRICISDIIASKEIPPEIKNNPDTYTGCVSGAISRNEVKRMLADAGFEEITIGSKENSEEIIRGWNISKGAENIVFSAYVQAVKPG